MGENTVRKHTQIAGQFFRKAVKQKLIDHDPFAGLPSTVQANKTRYYYVEQATIDAVIAKCADTEWKLIFALARFGGLRCPSEILELKWTDIDWAEEEMIVTGNRSCSVRSFARCRPMDGTHGRDNAEVLSASDQGTPTERQAKGERRKSEGKSKGDKVSRPEKIRDKRKREGRFVYRNSRCRELTEEANSGGGTRTPDTRIMIPLL